MGTFFAAIRIELLRLVRHRAALLTTFVMPAAIAAILVLALGGTDDVDPVTLAVVDDGDASAALFTESVVGNSELDGVVVWETWTDADAAIAAADREEIGAVIVIGPAGPTGLPTLTVGGDESPIATGIAAIIVDTFNVRAAAGAPDATSGLTMAIEAPGGASLDASVFWGPALGAFFLLMSLGYAAHRQVEDRRNGVLDRVASTVASPFAVAAGRSAASGLVGTVSLLALATTSQVVFGRPWGSWPQVLLVAAATSIAVAGIGSVLAGFARSGGQAQTLATVIAFLFGMAGGSFSPPGAATLSSLGRLTPNALSLDAFNAVSTTGSTADLAVPVSGLLAMAAVTFTFGALLDYRES